jgi:hypothetical protein
MEKPNLMESVTPHSGQYSFKVDLRLNAWLGVAMVIYLGVTALNKRHPEWSPLLQGSLALTPLVSSLLYVRSWVRFIRGLDELQRRVQLGAFLFAAMGTVIAGTAINILNQHGVPLGWLTHGLGMGDTFMLMFVLWPIGWALANCRYK